MTVEPDQTLGPGDARLAWRGGRAERDLAELERAATALVDAWLPATAAEPWPIDREDARIEWGDAMSDDRTSSSCRILAPATRLAAEVPVRIRRPGSRRSLVRRRPTSRRRRAGATISARSTTSRCSSSAVLGKTTMPVSQLLRLGRGAVVELDRKVGEPIDIYVNNRLVARGEVVIVDDHLGMTMTEIIKSELMSGAHGSSTG